MNLWNLYNVNVMFCELFAPGLVNMQEGVIRYVYSHVCMVYIFEYVELRVRLIISLVGVLATPAPLPLPPNSTTPPPHSLLPSLFLPERIDHAHGTERGPGNEEVPSNIISCIHLRLAHR